MYYNFAGRKKGLASGQLNRALIDDSVTALFFSKHCSWQFVINMYFPELSGSSQIKCEIRSGLHQFYIFILIIFHHN